MNRFDELLDRRDFSETADAILYARPRFSTIFFPLFALTFFAAIAWLAFIPFEQTIHARGDLRVAGHAMTIEAPQEGRVVAVAAREGAFVEKGSVLFRLDDAPARLELERLTTEIARVHETIALAQSQRERARNRGAVETGRLARDVARQRALHEAGILPNEMVENLESELRARSEAARQEELALEAQAVAARQSLARLESERARLSRTFGEHVIRAAASGVITRLQLPAADRLVTRGTVLAELTPRGRPLEFEAVVAPHDIARVRPDLRARVELDAYPRRQFGAIDGRVTFIAPDRDEHGYRIRIGLSPAQRDVVLRTGLTGAVAVVGDRRPLYRVLADRLGILQ